MFNLEYPIHLSGLKIIVAESASGAPAFITPFDPDTERLITDETEAELWCN